MTTAATRTSDIHFASRVRGRLAQHPTLILFASAGLAGLAAWLRIPGVARDTLWAEDGRNFLQGAVDFGPLNSLFIPYAGYLHTVPRLIAGAVVQLLPVSEWARGMTAGSCAVAGVVAVTVFVASRGIVPWMPGRIAIASLTVLAPLAPREVLGNAANLHSLLLWALFWIALCRPRTRASVVGLSLVALCGALTEVQSLFLVPLLLFRIRDRGRWPTRAMLLLGAMAQLGVTLTFPRGASGHGADDPLSIAYGYVINAVMPWALPQPAIGPVLAAAGPDVGIILLFPVAAAALLVLRRGTRNQRTAVVALAVESVVIFGASVVANPNSFYDYADMTPQQLADAWLTRYGVVPSMMLAAILLIGLSFAVKNRNRSDLMRSKPRMATAVALATVSGLLLVSAVAQFTPDYTRRSAGPEWQPQIAAAAQRCATLPEGSRIQLNETLGWHVRVPCDLLKA